MVFYKTETCGRVNIETCGPIARERVDKHVSMETNSVWNTFPSNEWSTNISLDTDTLYKRPFR
jgi:hypothetical protein